MNNYSKPRRGRPGLVLGLCSLVVLLTGCNSFFNSWFDPSQVGSFTREATLDIRTSLSIQDTPVGISGATDPKPEDLIPHFDEYVFKPGDALNVRVFELLARNTETTSQVTIDEIGTIDLPVLGQIRVGGMTRSEITAELRELLIKREIIRDPTIIVEPLVRRGLSFVVFGASPAPNLYPLSRPDTRLLEALNTSGGFVDTVTDIYVIRDESAAKPTTASKRGTTLPVFARASSPHTRVPLQLSDGIAGTASSASDPPPADGEQTADSVEDERDALINAVASPGDAESGDNTHEPAPRPRWVFVNGQWVETVGDETAASSNSKVEFQEPDPSPTAQPLEPLDSEPSIDWERLAGSEERRVIRISADGLRSGDYRQNIVIRGGDTIRLMAGQVGEYYMMGQVMRPGAYSITGRRMTLKTAIASAGNLAPLAWPDRCTVYRRYGDREEMHQVNLDAIFAGKEPDVLIKDHDLVLVGTHPAAPFLAVFRNAFRMTYGFGFVYDRNFADIDSYGSKINPSNVSNSYGSNFPNLFR